MRYCKYISSGYIDGIGTGDGGIEINKSDYDTIMTAIRNRPKDTATMGYRLRENLTWESYEIELTEEV